MSLSAVATPLQRELYRLYTSAQDGLSFNRLSFHLLGYTGPTLAVIRDTDGGSLELMTAVLTALLTRD